MMTTHKLSCAFNVTYAQHKRKLKSRRKRNYFSWKKIEIRKRHPQLWKDSRKVKKSVQQEEREKGSVSLREEWRFRKLCLNCKVISFERFWNCLTIESGKVHTHTHSECDSFNRSDISKLMGRIIIHITWELWIERRLIY